MSSELTRQEALESGATRYTPTRPCKRGHNALRYTASGACVECDREQRERLMAKYREKREAAKAGAA